jgi:hypothetical protein
VPVIISGAKSYSYHKLTQVLWSSTERIRHLFSKHLSQTEVSQLNIAVLTNQNVLRLQISVKDLAFVQITDGEGYLGSVELSLRLRQFFVLGKDTVELSSSDEVHEEVNTKFLLEHVLHADNEGMFDAEHDVLFQSQVLQLLRVNDHVLPDALHCINLASSLVHHHVDLSE